MNLIGCAAVFRGESRPVRQTAILRVRLQSARHSIFRYKPFSPVGAKPRRA